MTASCPSCGEPVAETDGFCEACGAELAAAVDSAGADRDHVELDIGVAAGVSDRGLRHSRNEDAMTMASAALPGGDGLVTVAVVCDGVSSAPRADEASLAGARAAIRVLLSGVRTGEDAEGLSVTAAHAAADALVPLADQGGSPAATYTAAIMAPDSVTVSWLGDSRVYWLSGDSLSGDGVPGGGVPGGGSECLTKDDSLAEEIVAAGLATMEQAMEMPQAHVITRWLGADMPEPEPHVTRFTPPGPGVVMLCSDGLWNYQPDPDALAGMALPTARTRPLAAAAALVDFAVESGGMDNITVVLMPFPPARPAVPVVSAVPESASEEDDA